MGHPFRELSVDDGVAKSGKGHQNAIVGSDNNSTGAAVEEC